MPVTHIHGDWTVDVKFSTDGRKLFSVACGHVARDCFCSLDDATRFLDLVDAASKACILFANECYPWDGYASYMDYKDHLQSFREQVFQGPAVIEEIERDTVDALHEYLDGDDPSDHPAIMDLCDKACKALHTVYKWYMDRAF